MSYYNQFTANTQLKLSPFFERTSKLNESQEWRRWSGYLSATNYDLTHENEYFAIRTKAALLDISPLKKYLIEGLDALNLLDRLVSFRKYLLDRNIELIDVPDEEYESMGCNVLTVAPRKAIMISGNSKTKQLLEKNNVEVYTYDGTEISIKGAGGPTCLTRPFLRISQ